MSGKCREKKSLTKLFSTDSANWLFDHAVVREDGSRVSSLSDVPSYLRHVLPLLLPDAIKAAQCEVVQAILRQLPSGRRQEILSLDSVVAALQDKPVMQPYVLALAMAEADDVKRRERQASAAAV
jgi:hypothetical protein